MKPVDRPNRGINRLRIYFWGLGSGQTSPGYRQPGGEFPQVYRAGRSRDPG
jgi:hypothetical protein